MQTSVRALTWLHTAAATFLGGDTFCSTTPFAGAQGHHSPSPARHYFCSAELAGMASVISLGPMGRKRRREDGGSSSSSTGPASGGASAGGRRKVQLPAASSACPRTAVRALPPPSLPSAIVAELSARRAELARADTADLDTELSRIEAALADCEGKRWMRRAAVDLESERATLLAEKRARTSGSKLREFDAAMKPVVRRLRAAAEQLRRGKCTRAVVEDAEREARKRLTPRDAPIALHHAVLGDMCDDCGVSMRVVASDSLLGCPQCAKTRAIPVMSAPAAESEYSGGAAYAQKSRLLEWLEFCQAKEYAEPAPDVLDIVMQHLVATRSTGLEEHAGAIAAEREARGPFKSATDALARLGARVPGLGEKLQSIKACSVRAAMQAASAARHEQRLRKFYERAPKYAAYISGYWPLRFSAAQEERIRRLYAVAAPAYDKFRKPTQPNWPGGYAYFLRCLCILMGWDEFAGHFNISAGPKNAQDREVVRRKIWAEELDWEYVPCTPPTPGAASSAGAAAPAAKRARRLAPAGDANESDECNE